MKSKYPIIVIAGPTASGKSDIAISVAKEINGYIINADSRQVYKGMRIGTAQPIPERIDGNCWYIDGVKHFLYGYKDINNPLNISIYQKDVQNIFNTEEGIPILVGGTGLYIDCIVHNYDIKDSVIDEEKRKELSLLNIYQLKELIDPSILKNMNESDVNNPRRLIRVIEGRKISKKNSHLNHMYFVMDIDKEILKRRISERVENMFKNGLEEEVRDLFNRYDMSLPVFNTIGYQEFREYFNGRRDITEVKNEIVLHTNQYAKRQRTWFRRNKEAVWKNNTKEILQEAEKFITIS